MMARTATKIASGIIVGLLAGVPLTVPRQAANAAECLTSPGQDATQGQHWYYRIDHANNKRHCWYLRDEGGKAARTTPSDDESSPAATPAMSSAGAAPRSLEDAHAEFTTSQPRENTVAMAAPAVAPSPASPAGNPVPNPVQNSARRGAGQQGNGQADMQGAAVATRWPSAVAAAAPTPQTADSDESDSVAAVPAPPLAAAPAPPPATLEKHSASLQMLFAVIAGALALAGLTASIVYRVGRGPRLDTRQRREALWEGVDTGPRPPWVDPAIEQTAPRPSPVRDRAPSPVTRQRYEKIEEILAQLVQHGEQSDA
jgi:hypothetical protein